MYVGAFIFERFFILNASFFSAAKVRRNPQTAVTRFTDSSIHFTESAYQPSVTTSSSMSFLFIPYLSGLPARIAVRNDSAFRSAL